MRLCRCWLIALAPIDATEVVVEAVGGVRLIAEGDGLGGGGGTFL